MALEEEWRQPTSVWWSPTGKAHIGRRSRPALCGYVLPRAAKEWSIEEDSGNAWAALCGKCLRSLGKVGPWIDGAGWVRPPEVVALEVYVGGHTEAWRLNELTWRRVVALANRQRLTRSAVVEVTLAAQATRDDPDREHVFRAMGGNTLLIWGDMVGNGWCPDAPRDIDEDHDSTSLTLAWMAARGGIPQQ
jgi:hypothetical protein